MGDQVTPLVLTSVIPDWDSKEFSLADFEPPGRTNLSLLILVIVVIATGAGNDVSGKIVTVPMDKYSFLIGLFSSGIYVLIYFGILAVRYRLGHVTWKHLKYVWRIKWEKPSFWSKIPRVKYFLLMGLLDGIAVLLVLIARPYISGQLVVLLPQVALVYVIACSMVVLSSRFSFWQLWSVFLVLSGVYVTLLSDFSSSNEFSGALKYVLVMLLSPAPQALSFVLKEKLFKEFPKLDIFVMNSHCSLFQFLLQPLFIPLAFAIIPQLQEEPPLQYVKESFLCFVGITPSESQCDCSPMPVPFVVYILFNLAYNTAVLFLVKWATTLLSFMVMRAILPVSVVLFYFHWPLLPKTEFSPYVIVGGFVILLALMFYRLASHQQQKHSLTCCSPQLFCPWEDSEEGETSKLVGSDTGIN